MGSGERAYKQKPLKCKTADKHESVAIHLKHTEARIHTSHFWEKGHILMTFFSPLNWENDRSVVCNRSINANVLRLVTNY